MEALNWIGLVLDRRLSDFQKRVDIEDTDASSTS